jgi:5,5'-dehydrodivanillate O-demethylase
MAWASQGPIADRSKEHLGKSDLGVIMLRRLFQEQLKLVESGADPLGVIRDESVNDCITLPQERKKLGNNGYDFLLEILTMGQCRYSPLAKEVLELFERAEAATAGTA